MTGNARFQFVRELGRGAMGTVDLVHDLQKDRLVARKRPMLVDARAAVRFKNEFRTVERLSHPNVVRLFELGEDDGGLYFTMEYVDGVPLDAFDAFAGGTRHERLRVLARILPQLIDALRYIHSHDLVHHDLKPMNVLVRRDDGAPKLLDFGVLGRVTTTAAEELATGGTPGYMAPEQIRGEAVGREADHYALGVLLFELLTGHAPFEGSSRKEIIEQHLSAAAPGIDHVPIEVDAICRRLLEKSPHERATLDDVEAILLPALSALGAAARPPSLPANPRRPSRRPPHEESFGSFAAALRRQPIALPLVGRDELVDGALGIVEKTGRLVLTGPSGIGKSAVASEISERLGARGWTVLTSRVRLNERVPFNAVDGAIDALARILDRRVDADPEIERAARKARTVFPALAVSGVDPSHRCKELVRFRLFGRVQAPPSRADAFDAVRALLDSPVSHSSSGGARGARTVMVIDDFQWADDDSLNLLSRLLDGGGAARAGAKDGGSCAFVFIMRDDVVRGAASDWLDAHQAHGGDRAFESRVVPPLSEEALATIALHFTRMTRARSREGLKDNDREGKLLSSLKEIASGFGGRPLLAEIAGRALAEDRSPELTKMVDRESALDRETLSVLVAADDWTDIHALAELTDSSVGKVSESIDALIEAGLVRRARSPSTGSEIVDLYHDGIRRVAVELFAPKLPAIHSRIADRCGESAALLSWRTPERRVRHLLAASRVAEAAVVARSAATNAEAQRAYGLAAEMYAIALRGDAHVVDRIERTTLKKARAHSLEKVGRYADAASVWGELSAMAANEMNDEEQMLDFALSEATALVAANDTTRGLDRLDEVLGTMGELPVQSTSLRAQLTTATILLGPSGWRVRRVLAPRRGERRGRGNNATHGERDVRLGILLSFIDPACGVRYLLRARDVFRDVGAIEQGAVCDFTLTVLASVGSRNAHVPLARKYLESARTLTATLPSPTGATRGMESFVVGLEALRRGAFSEGKISFETARREFASIGSVTEQLMSASWRTMCDVYAQDLSAVRSSVAEFRNLLTELGGGLILAHVDLTEAYIRVLEGKGDEAEQLILRRGGNTTATSKSTTTSAGDIRPNTQRAAAFIYRHLIDIYRDERDGVRGAASRFREALRAARSFRFLSTMYAGPFSMIGALLEANAMRRGEADVSMRVRARRVEHFASIMDAAPPFTAGASHRARAYALDALHRPEEALAALSRAEQDSEKYGRKVDVAIARWQRGKRLGGDEGREAMNSATKLIRRVGAAESLLQEDAGLR